MNNKVYCFFCGDNNCIITSLPDGEQKIITCYNERCPNRGHQFAVKNTTRVTQYIYNSQINHRLGTTAGLIIGLVVGVVVMSVVYLIWTLISKN